MTEKETTEAVKNSIDLKAYIESRGIQLKKKGKDYFGRCPFHDNDDDPSLSVTPSKKIWHCFGCGKTGDVIEFVRGIDNISFHDAVKLLEKEVPFIQHRSKRGDPKPAKPTEPRIRLILERGMTIYEKNLADHEKAKKYLEQRGIDAGLWQKHRVGFCTGNLNTILPDNGTILNELESIGILIDKTYERFTDCIVIPVFDADGNIVTLYGRHIKETEKRHLFLPGREKGIWNTGIIKTRSEIIITESIIDALSVETAGFANVIALHGTALSDRMIMMFKEYSVGRVILLLDGDDPGEKAAKQLKEKLNEFSVTVKKLPESHDPNSFLQKYGAQSLAEFITRDEKEELPESPPRSFFNPSVLEEPDGFTATYGIRKYKIMGLEKSPRKLKATVRLESSGKLHVDTLDFYSAKARKALAQDICRTFNEIPETIETDITRLMTVCEKMPERAKQENKPDIAEITGKEKEEALAFGRSENLIDQILTDFETCGLIGEDANKLLGYIAMTSRKRHDPLSMLILSSSGAGKSALQDAVVNFCPPEDLVKLTSLSGKALFYKDQTSLKHKVLAIEEGDGADDAAYAIRSLISSGVLVSESTIKDLSTGRLTTMENRVEGPTAVFFTTTNPETDPETMSRFFVTGIDESREQTRKILSFQREKSRQDFMEENIRVDAVLKKHRNFQRLLKPVAVKNPFSDQLTYSDDRLQGRRDQPKYLQLIKSVAFTRQMQKEIKTVYKNGQNIPCIEVDGEDIRIANDLTHRVLGRSLDELSRPGRALLLHLDDMIEKRVKGAETLHKDSRIDRTSISFTRRDIREFTGWSNARVHRYLKELVDLEYVLIDCGKNGSMYRYRLAYEGQGKNGEKFVLGLTSVENLKGIS